MLLSPKSILEQKKEDAALAYQVERAVVERKKPTDISKLMQRAHGKCRNVVEDALDNLSQVEKKVHEVWEELQRRCGPRDNFDEKSFFALTGIDPHGEVSVEKQKGCLVISLDDRRDGSTLEKIHNGENLSPNDGACGSFLSHFPFANIRFPLIWIHGKNGTKEVENIFLHELQHFIFFLLLDETNATLPLARSCVDRRPLKDEILGYVREGTELLLQSVEGYKEMFPKPQGNDRYAIRFLSRFLKKHAGVFQGQHARAMLCYFLINLPLSDFPRWLKALERHGMVFDGKEEQKKRELLRAC